MIPYGGHHHEPMRYGVFLRYTELAREKHPPAKTRNELVCHFRGRLNAFSVACDGYGDYKTVGEPNLVKESRAKLCEAAASMRSDFSDAEVVGFVSERQVARAKRKGKDLIEVAALNSPDLIVTKAIKWVAVGLFTVGAVLKGIFNEAVTDDPRDFCMLIGCVFGGLMQMQQWCLNYELGFWKDVKRFSDSG